MEQASACLIPLIKKIFPVEWASACLKAINEIKPLINKQPEVIPLISKIFYEKILERKSVNMNMFISLDTIIYLTNFITSKIRFVH